MCSAAVLPGAEVMLATLLGDMCRALCPDEPESVIVGPVDFGTKPDHLSDPLGPEG